VQLGVVVVVAVAVVVVVLAATVVVVVLAILDEPSVLAASVVRNTSRVFRRARDVLLASRGVRTTIPWRGKREIIMLLKWYPTTNIYYHDRTMIIFWLLFSASFYFLPVRDFLLFDATTASGEDGKAGDGNGDGDFVIAR
jgi:hypothetical protein